MKINNKHNIILKTIIIISSCCLIYSIINITKWFQENYKTKEITEEIIDKTITEEVNEHEAEIEIISPQVEIPKENPYWDYIKMNLITVNFQELKQKNNETVGWIQVNGTNINYPFVQTNNNDYYLTHSFDNSYNSAGWVFMDYRNNLSTFDKNTIIYAHGRLDNTMFGTLKKIFTNGWLNNTENHVIKLSTEYENTLWQVFSVYHIPTTNDYLETEFAFPENFENFYNMLIERSTYNFNTTLTQDDKILTLSTCYNDTEKVVLHAKLIKKEIRQ